MQIILTVPLALVLLGAIPTNSVAEPERSTPDRKMALTFDDLPAQRAPALSEERIRMITRSLLEILESNQVPAIGFVNESKLYQDDQIVPWRVVAVWTVILFIIWWFGTVTG